MESRALWPLDNTGTRPHGDPAFPYVLRFELVLHLA